MIAPLGLADRLSEQLLEDAMLIAARYYHQQRLANLGLGLPATLAALAAAAKSAQSLHDHLGLFAQDVEALILAMPAFAGTDAETVDVVTLVREIEKFARAARKTVALMKPGHGSRRPERERNVALALITWATEEAAGERVSISEGTKSRPGRHFSGASGRFVVAFMGLLSGAGERKLHGVFDQMRCAYHPKQ